MTITEVEPQSGGPLRVLEPDAPSSDPAATTPTQADPSQGPAGRRSARPRRTRRPFGEALRAGTRSAVATFTSPLLPADFRDLVDPLGSASRLRARIEAIVPETADAATLVLRPGRGWAGHVPGQYIRIGVDVDGVRLWRAYSITSGPRRDGRITVTVKAIPDGKVSNHLVRRAQPGTVVQLDQATGDFRMPEPLPERVLLVTAGSGITPAMGMLRHHGPRLDDVVVVHSAPTRDDVIFGGELRDLALGGWIRLSEQHTDSHGMLSPEQLARLVPDWRERQAWACGPTRMLDDLEAHWASAGIAERLHTERFRAAITVTGDGGPVAFGESGPTVEASGDTPLLDVGEAAGVLMPSGCRMGICYGCVLPLKTGAVRDLRNGQVTTAEPGDGVKVQTCINAAAGPCELEL